MKLGSAAEVIEVVQIERAVFCHELDVVVSARVAQRLDGRRPDAKDVRAYCRLAGREEGIL